MTLTYSATESQIQAAILDYLALRGILAWRTNSGAIITQAGRMVHLAPKGTADIIGIMPGSGKLLAIECKTRKGKVTPEQEEFLQRVRDNGGCAFVARSVEDVERMMGGNDD